MVDSDRSIAKPETNREKDGARVRVFMVRDDFFKWKWGFWCYITLRFAVFKFEREGRERELAPSASGPHVSNQFRLMLLGAYAS